jgi:sugar/nucleoside kinase (ribokinase family)
MKFLVVGHFAIDIVHLPDGKERAQFGGIFNSVAALSSAVKPSDTIVPVFGVNRDQFSGVVAELGKLQNVDPAAVYASDEPTNTVHVTGGEGGAATLCSPTIMQPIPFAAMKKFVGANAILINMASGSDITLETMDHIRLEARGSGTILFDFHNLTLGVNSKRERVRQPLDTWRRWAFMNDIVQLNEEEIGGLAIETLTEEQTVGHLMTLGVKHVVVTRGQNGAAVYSSEHKHVHRNDIPGLPGSGDESAVGSGDVFGAAMLAKYAETRDAVQSATFANATAAAKVSGGNGARVEQMKGSRT